MNFDIALLLTQDGITAAAIYAMIALGVVLIFNVTRIAFVSFGDLIAYSTLTLASIQLNQLPGTIWVVVLLVSLALVMESVDLYRRKRLNRLPRSLITFGLIPLAPVGLAIAFQNVDLPMFAQVALTMALILPIGPLIYRVVFRPMLDSSVLALLMASVALHFALAGLALLFFGPEGFKTQPYISGAIQIAGLDITNESIVIIGTVLLFVGSLFYFFEYTLTGKALRATAVNRTGARLVGIRTTSAGSTAFLLATGMAAISGVLIGPTLTVYYDTGFLIGLKGFVGSVMGGFISYPLAGLGALLIGLLESFSSFYSSAFKDVIVFAMLIPVVILRWLLTRTEVEEEEEEL
jgi:branched-chain amino acid transport system permease protein